MSLIPRGRTGRPESSLAFRAPPALHTVRKSVHGDPSPYHLPDFSPARSKLYTANGVCFRNAPADPSVNKFGD